MNPYLPPGCTDAELERRFGAPRCKECGVRIADSDEGYDEDVGLCPRCRPEPTPEPED